MESGSVEDALPKSHAYPRLWAARRAWDTPLHMRHTISESRAVEPPRTQRKPGKQYKERMARVFGTVSAAHQGLGCRRFENPAGF